MAAPLPEQRPLPRSRLSRRRRDELRALTMMAITVLSVLAVVAVAVPLATYFSQHVGKPERLELALAPR